MKIYLIGFMASGKTTIGEKLAEMMDYSFIDLDEYLQQKHGKTIKELFEISGEDFFRKIENEALREVAALEGNHIVASGGGTSCFYNSVDFMNKTGVTVYLRVEVDELVARLIKSKTDRPLLWGKSKEDLNNYILRVLDERKKYYQKARITIDNSKMNPEALAETLKDLIE